MREHVYLAPASRVFDAADFEDQQQFEDIIRKLCEDPDLGPPVSTLVDVLPLDFLRYDDGRYRVVYDLPDEATVRIWIMAKVV